MIRNFANALKLVRAGKAFIKVAHTAAHYGRVQAFCYLIDDSLVAGKAYEKVQHFYTLTDQDFIALESEVGSGIYRALILRPDEGSIRYHFLSDKCELLKHFQVNVTFVQRPDDPIVL